MRWPKFDRTRCSLKGTTSQKRISWLYFNPACLHKLPIVWNSSAATDLPFVKLDFPLRIALLQINPTAGDIGGNSALIVDGVKRARELGVDLVVTPELALMGYLPRDLLMSRGFVRKSCDELARIATEVKDAPPVLVGIATPNPAEMGRPLFNSSVMLRDGVIGPAFHKTLLPTYDVFDEDRYFEPAASPGVLELNGWRLGI